MRWFLILTSGVIYVFLIDGDRQREGSLLDRHPVPRIGDGPALLLSVRLDVLLGGLAGVVRGMLVMGVGQVRVMSGLLVIPALVVLCRFTMMPGRLFVMVRGLVMMVCSFLGHRPPPRPS